MQHRLPTVLVAASALVGHSFAQTCREVCDLQTSFVRAYSSSVYAPYRPEGGRYARPALYRCGSVWFFAAETRTSGRELWKTDGTAAGTVQVKDIHPGPGDSSLNSFVCCNGTLFFAADDGVSGSELWKSDGTAAGTVRVKDIRPGSAASQPRWAICFQGVVYFAADDGTHGDELWRSDGTSAGTALVKDIRTGLARSTPRYFQPIGNGFVFQAEDATHGRELWRSDGTAAGTMLLKDINPGSGDSLPGEFGALGGKVLFPAYNPTYGEELWHTDGTAAGTRLLKNIAAGTQSSFVSFYYSAQIGNTLYFRANNRVQFGELWKTDGTAAGTVMVKDIAPGTNSHPEYLTAVGSTLFFNAYSSSTRGRELWKSNGTAAGTVMVKDIFPGLASSDPSHLVAFGGKLYFQAINPTNGHELWVSDGTSAGTRMLHDTWPGSNSGGAYGAVVVGNKLIFGASSPTTGYELMETDGTTVGTKLFKDINPGNSNAGSTPTGVTACWSNTVVFGAFGDDVGREPYAYDLTTGRCTLIADIYPGRSSSDPKEFTCCGDKVYFQARGQQGQELYEWDGRSIKVHDIGPGSSFASHLTRCGNKLFFTANDGRNGYELWVADPVTSSVTMLEVWPGRDSGVPSTGAQLASGKGKLYFVGRNPTYGEEIFVSDGTPAGTGIAVDTWPGSGSSRTTSLTSCTTASGVRLYYSAADRVHGIELHTWDGTRKTVLDLSRGHAQPMELTCCGSRVYFTADDGTGKGRELFLSDGTAAGTRMLADLIPGPSSSAPNNLTCCGGRVFFNAFGPGEGRELFVTDGTTAGTKLVKNIAERHRSSDPKNIRCVGDRVFFTADDGVHGIELWTSDGTANGTELVCDIHRDRAASNPSDLVACGGNLYFVATEPHHGAELWVLERPGAMVERVGEGCDGITLDASAAPRIGSSFRLRGECAPAGHVGVTFLMPAPRTRPLHIPNAFAPSCWAWFRLLSPDFASLTASWQSPPISIPSLTTLAGVRLFYQTFYIDLTSVIPLKTSNGLRLTIGR